MPVPPSPAQQPQLTCRTCPGPRSACSLRGPPCWLTGCPAPSTQPHAVGYGCCWGRRWLCPGPRPHPPWGWAAPTTAHSLAEGEMALSTLSARTAPWQSGEQNGPPGSRQVPDCSGQHPPPPGHQRAAPSQGEVCVVPPRAEPTRVHREPLALEMSQPLRRQAGPEPLRPDGGYGMVDRRQCRTHAWSGSPAPPRQDPQVGCGCPRTPSGSDTATAPPLRRRR